jgi:hypothetical protein
METQSFDYVLFEQILKQGNRSSKKKKHSLR